MTAPMRGLKTAPSAADEKETVFQMSATNENKPPDREGAAFPEPTDRRMLWSCLSLADCVRLVEASLTAPRVGHTISFGLSDNRVKPVDNAGAAHLGYRAQDNSEPFRARVEPTTPVSDPKTPSAKYPGGWFCEPGHPDDESNVPSFRTMHIALIS